MSSRQEQLAQRAAQIERLRTLPEAMRCLPQWLVWKFLPPRSAGAKPPKVPFYLSGQPRGWPKGKPKDGKPTPEQPQVEQGDELDRAELVSFEAAIAALQSRQTWAGIGFAFLPGDGLIGVDIDGAIDRETGEISKRCQIVMAMCPSYAERSVSGTGVHIILTGQSECFKEDAIGLEVYCGHQYFTCTGDHWAGTPAEPVPMDGEALGILRGMVDQAKRQRQADKEAEQALKRAAQDGQAKPARAPQPSSAGPQDGNDFQRVNAAAYQHLDAWVPHLLPGATRWRDGYRITSKALGRDLQEDLQILPEGIMDFGEEQGKSPVDLVMQYGGKSAREALLWLAPLVGVTLKPARPRADGAGRREEPPDEGEPAGAGARRASSPPPPSESGPPASGGGGGGDGGEGGPPTAQDGGEGDEADKGGGQRRRKPSKRSLANLAVLHERFAYQYGSKLAWDTRRLEAIELANLRNTYGSDAVKLWLGSDDRWMVYQEDVMFEPGKDLGPHRINLYAGMSVEPLEPEPGECEVMLELLRYLCSTSEAPGMGPEDIVDWVLCWLSLPLQQPGAKMATALVFHGPQGTGKNLFFDCIRDLYGEYGVMVGQTELEEKYNAWLSAKLFIVGDEVVSRQEMYKEKNRLKWIISQENKIPIRSMHADTRWESNHANLAFLSNEGQPLALEPGDRRFLVVYTPLPDEETLYARVRAFLANDGARKFLHYLQHRPLGEFERHTKPPLTKAKATLIELGLKPAERFMHELLDGYLPLPKKVCSVEQMYRCFKRWCDVTGARFFPQQAEFTAQAGRYARERIERDAAGKRQDPPYLSKNVQVPDEAASTGRKSYRIWIPRGCGFREESAPVDGEDDPYPPTEGRWARKCIDDFEPIAWSFMRSPRQAGEAEGEGDGNA